MVYIRYFPTLYPPPSFQLYDVIMIIRLHQKDFEILFMNLSIHFEILMALRKHINGIRLNRSTLCIISYLLSFDAHTAKSFYTISNRPVNIACLLEGKQLIGNKFCSINTTYRFANQQNQICTSIEFRIASSLDYFPEWAPSRRLSGSVPVIDTNNTVSVSVIISSKNLLQYKCL